MGRLRGRSPICWKKEKSFFQKFFRVLSVLFNGALLGFLSSLKQEKPPEYPRGLFLCPENVRQAVSQRLYSPGRARAFPLGRKRRADTAAYLPHHPCSAYLFICQGGATGRPLVFEEGWSSGRGGERPSSEGSPSPIPYPFPCPTRRIRLP